MISIIILTLLAIFSILQLSYWLGPFRKLANHKSSPGLLPAKPPVSVIICAKNEKLNLLQNLPFIIKQDYPEYEVIVVNDHSTDDTASVLEAMQKKANHLRIIHLTESETDRPGKKWALKSGIDQAKYDWVLVTDADCKPTGNDWVKSMVEHVGEREVILGYGPMIYSPGLVNWWSRFETILTGMHYFSLALWGYPYMGVGRNLLYKKKLYDYEKLKPEWPSGDDDLLIQSIDTGRVSIQVDPKAFMYSESESNWISYFRQKFRHVSTSRFYKIKFKIYLGLYAFSHIAFWVCFIFGLMTFPLASILILIIKWCLQLIVFRRICNRLQDKNLLYWFPVLDFVQTLYYVMLSIISLGKYNTSKSNKW